MTCRLSLGMASAIALASLASGCSVTDSAQNQASGSSSDEAPTVLAPFTDHYSMRIEQPAGVVWEHLKRLYVDGERSRQQGYEVTPLEGDLTAYLGGTKAVQPEVTDRPEVTIRLSALDEDAKLLSLMIELENPVPVYVVHQVRPDGPNASIYQNIIITKWPVTASEGQSLTAEYVRDKMIAAVKFHNSEVEDIMQREKAVIEALD